MKARTRTVNDHGTTYTALMFACPGCISGGPDGYDGIHLLPVNCDLQGKASWRWNGDLEKPTLSPSILTQGYSRCHSYLAEGVFSFLTDSDHPLSGKQVPLPDLPDWAVELSGDEENSTEES